MARSSKSKIPKFGSFPHPIKSPRTVNDVDSYLKRKLDLRFEFADTAKCWNRDQGVSNCDPLKFIGFWKSMESRVWSDVLRNKKRDHSIPVGNLSKPARDRIIELKMEDMDELWSFHFDQIGRVWGVRFDHEFRVLWFDPDHMVYPVDIQNKGKSRKR